MANSPGARKRRREDQGRKRELYRSLGVREYWQYDPTRDYLEPPLQGLELRAGKRVALLLDPMAAGRDDLPSPYGLNVAGVNLPERRRLP